MRRTRVMKMKTTSSVPDTRAPTHRLNRPSLTIHSSRLNQDRQPLAQRQTLIGDLQLTVGVRMSPHRRLIPRLPNSSMKRQRLLLHCTVRQPPKSPTVVGTMEIRFRAKKGSKLRFFPPRLRSPLTQVMTHQQPLVEVGTALTLLDLQK
ncbi:unnamed protein product, partial [Nesidiocoris tenuis]